MKTTFNIGGAPTVSYIGKKAFEDRMTWNEKGELVLVKTNAEDATEITAVRALSEDGRLLVMVRCWETVVVDRFVARRLCLTSAAAAAAFIFFFQNTTEAVRQEPQGREGDARGADLREVVSW